ncbi:MAG: hypothetical protein ACXVZ4_16095, partial [Gaiellaceae bacterium]
AHGAELVRQAEAMEGYFERVVETLTGAGYRWYETANFCRPAAAAGGRDLRAQHNLGYWRGHDYLGLGVGAVSTVRGRRWRTTPSVGRYLAALSAGRPPERDVEDLDQATRRAERILLGLRLDEPLPLAGLGEAVDTAGLARVEQLGLAVREGTGDAEAVVLTPRGRLLGGGVTAEVLG